MARRPFSSILIANRGEIVVRIAHTARELGLRTIGVYSDPDRDAAHVAACDSAVDIGGAAPADSYLVAQKILDAARASGAEAIHPGYGFLSENAAFADAVETAGLVWIGPPAAAIRAMGDKAAARRQAAEWGAPVVAGYDDEDQGEAALVAAAKRIGFPIMIKASAGGGGRGMRRVDKAKDFAAAARAAAAEALKAFGDSRLVLEKAVDRPRHIEIQVLADAHGNVVHLGERDCSIQRRHQKIIEEAPSPALDEKTRAAMGACAVMITEKVGYVGAGTVEFLLDAAGQFTFMEMNTRLQVEHPVTEMITGVDLVEQQIRIARGEVMDLTQDDIWFSGHAIEARLCAESPVDDYMPRTGEVLAWKTPTTRVDHALRTGATVSPHYDSMLAKVIVHAPSRQEATEALARALDDTRLLGVETNRAFLAKLARDEAFQKGEDVTTAFLAERYGDAASRGVAASDNLWAIAAWITACGGASRSAIPASWRDWSNAAPLPLRWKLEGAGETREGLARAEQCGATVERGESVVRIDGVIGEAGETFDARVGGRGLRVTHVLADGALWITEQGGGDHRFKDLRLAPPVRAISAAEAGAVSATMNGKIAAVLVAAGAAVKSGDALVTLEAMKMEHVMTAPANGRVKAITVAVGEQVSPGQVLVELEPEKVA
ncbi:MAG: ATP-grasp domain-containing protein [Hyphomonadaceae bacterium]|nr:ATP-grasp domain-containing protein [Hyphomonadaceae bacterium]